MSRRREGMSIDMDLEFEDSIYKYYKDLKDGRDRVEVSNQIFECPYCHEYDKTQYAFSEIVRHASRIGRESISASYRSRARHLGLERYLKRCVDKRNKSSMSRTEHHQDDDNAVTSRVPENSSGRNLEHGLQSLKRSFELIKDKAIAELKTISEIEKEKEMKETKLVGSLANALNMMDKQCEEIKTNISRTETNSVNMMRQKEDMEKAYNEELQIKVKQQRDELKLIYIGHEQTKSKLQAEQEDLRLYEKVLQERDDLNETESKRLDYLKEKNEKAIMEQKKAEEKMMKLVEAQKKEKNQLHQKIIKLVKNLDDMQRTKLEIEQVKGAVEVIKHFREDRDVMIKFMEENLKEKEDELEDLEALNESLIVMERKSNDSVQDARKELIHGFRDRPGFRYGPIWKSSIGVKRIGDFDDKLIFAAAKKKYPASEAVEKAMEFGLLLEEKLRDPSWHPFKVIMHGEDHKEVLDEEDDYLKTIKTEWGNEVYKTVVEALTEMNQYNPSGRYPVLELWNFKEGKRASIGDCVDLILTMWKASRRRRN